MAKIALFPRQLVEQVTLENRTSGDNPVLFGTITQENFDELLAAGAEFEDLEDSHDHEEAEYFED